MRSLRGRLSHRGDLRRGRGSRSLAVLDRDQQAVLRPRGGGDAGRACGGRRRRVRNKVIHWIRSSSLEEVQQVSSQHTAGSRPPWVDADLFPFESRFLELDGNTVHYIDEGSGPILLMLHGNPTWSFEYRQVIEALRDR